MVGATLSLGGYVTAAAVTQFGLVTSSASVSSSVQDRTAGTLVSFVYSVTTSPGSCPEYGGAPEGGALTVAVFDYGSTPFTPVAAALNGTLVAGTFSSVAPGSMGTAVLEAPTGVCVHASGQTVLLEDSSGGEVQLET